LTIKLSSRLRKSRKSVSKKRRKPDRLMEREKIRFAQRRESTKKASSLSLQVNLNK
jgi:hypothetical protein